MVSGFGAQLNGLHASFARQSVFAACRGVLTSDCLARFAWRPVLRTGASLLQADTIPFPSPFLLEVCLHLARGRGEFFRLRRSAEWPSRLFCMAKRLRRLPRRSDIGLPCSVCLAASPADGRFASAGEKSHPCPSQFLPEFVYIVREDEVKFFGFGAQLNGRLGCRCILSWFAACRGVLTLGCFARFRCRPALWAIASLLQAKNFTSSLVTSYISRLCPSYFWSLLGW